MTCKSLVSDRDNVSNVGRCTTFMDSSHLYVTKIMSAKLGEILPLRELTMILNI